MLVQPSTHLSSLCSYSSPAAVRLTPRPPHGGNRADSAPQLPEWPVRDTRCSWPDPVPDTPHRSCGSPHKCGPIAEDGGGRGEKGGPHFQMYINCYKHDSRFFFASNNAKHPFFPPKRGRFLNDALPFSPNRYYASTCQFKSLASEQKPQDLF